MAVHMVEFGFSLRRYGNVTAKLFTTGNAGPTLRQTYLASDAKLPGKKLLTQLSWNKIILVKVNDTAVTILCPLR